MNTLPTGTAQVDFELEQYAQEVHHEVNSLAYADEDGAVKEDKFTGYVMEILAEAEETESYLLCHYEKENKWENIQFKINGYALNEGYETLDIFVTWYRDSFSIYKLPKVDFDKLIKWPTDFVNAAFKGYHEEIEPSSEAHGLAKLLCKHRDEFDRVNVFILSNGIIPHDPPSNFRLKGFDGILFNFHIWDIERLHRLAQSKSNREPVEIDFKGKLNEALPCLKAPIGNGLYECYLAIVPGRVLAALYHNYSTRLLESNVRAFLQQTGKVNKGIRDTIIGEEPFMFLPYNNGLATTAQEVTTEEIDGKLYITAVKDFQIVNGGQTTASLFHTQKRYKNNLADVFVQMKLTVIRDEERKNQVVPNISRFANSQTAVSELDLTSNNPFLQQLEIFSRTTYAIDPDDRNHQTVWYFERVKGQYKESLNKESTPGRKQAFQLKYPKNQVVTKSDLAKYMNIWKLLPHHVAKGSQKNYTLFLKEIDKEFKGGKKPGRVYWQDVVANAILFQTTDLLFGRKHQNPVGDTSVKAHTVTYTLALLHYDTDNLIDLGKIWNEQRIPDDLQVELKKGLYYVYAFFESLGAALVSEAAKSEKNWTALIQKGQSPWDMKILAAYLLTPEQKKLRYEVDKGEDEEADRNHKYQLILSKGPKFWDGLKLFAINERIFTENQENFIARIKQKVIRKDEFLTSEIEKGIEILQVLETHGIDTDRIQNLSKLEENKTVDPLEIINKLKALTSADWSQIIDLGEQTGILQYEEISALKIVQQKLKRKETPDARRLEITDSAIKKLKKFKINY